MAALLTARRLGAVAHRRTAAAAMSLERRLAGATAGAVSNAAYPTTARPHPLQQRSAAAAARAVVTGVRKSGVTPRETTRAAWQDALLPAMHAPGARRRGRGAGGLPSGWSRTELNSGVPTTPRFGVSTTRALPAGNFHGQADRPGARRDGPRARHAGGPRGAADRGASSTPTCPPGLPALSRPGTGASESGFMTPQIAAAALVARSAGGAGDAGEHPVPQSPRRGIRKTSSRGAWTAA